MYTYIIYSYLCLYMCVYNSIFIVVSSYVHNYILYGHIKVTSIDSHDMRHMCTSNAHQCTHKRSSVLQDKRAIPAKVI